VFSYSARKVFSLDVHKVFSLNVHWMFIKRQCSSKHIPLKKCSFGILQDHSNSDKIFIDIQVNRSSDRMIQRYFRLTKSFVFTKLWRHSVLPMFNSVHTCSSVERGYTSNITSVQPTFQRSFLFTRSLALEWASYIQHPSSVHPKDDECSFSHLLIPSRSFSHLLTPSHSLSFLLTPSHSFLYFTYFD